jgi:NTP pyrophosphatase (non-canonical NTP hydrolase)
MSIEDVMEKVNQFASDRDWDQFHTPKNLASSISIESGELMEAIQWESPTFEEISSDPEKRKKIEEELADVMIYSLRFCSKLGSDPIEIMHSKLEENSEKYPVSKSKGSAKKYDEL